MIRRVPSGVAPKPSVSPSVTSHSYSSSAFGTRIPAGAATVPSPAARASIGAIEPAFYATLVEKAGLDAAEFQGRQDPADWPALRERLTAIIAQRTRADWCALLEDSDCCATPVLSMREAPAHPHNVARGAFVEVGGVTQPAPSPRFSRTPGAIQGGPVTAGEGGADALAEWGVSP
jgi:alpha-methylacyl-CoA racemase